MGQLRNPHPGEILKEEFLNEIGNRIPAIVNCTRDVTADTDLRLCKFFTLSEGYFLRLQNAFDTLEGKKRHTADQLAMISPYKAEQAA
jgi:plasmid maintenance system antidote protein VapI